VNTTREHILQTAREWIKSAAGLTDDQVIPADDKGPRPELPYVTVKVTAHDIQIGEDEDLHAIGTTVTVGAAAVAHDYELTVNGELFSYTRTASDTEATVATALAALVDDSETAGASASSAVILVWPEDGELSTSTVDAALTVEEDGPPVSLVRGVRTATLSVQGYGDTATTWLELAAGQLRAADIAEDLDEAGLSIQALGGQTNLAALVDTEIESRVLREFEVTYEIVQPAREGVAFGQAVIDVTMGPDLEDEDTTLTYTITATE
jgi:hypothetical protein